MSSISDGHPTLIELSFLENNPNNTRRFFFHIFHNVVFVLQYVNRSSSTICVSPSVHRLLNRPNVHCHVNDDYGVGDGSRSGVRWLVASTVLPFRPPGSAAWLSSSVVVADDGPRSVAVFQTSERTGRDPASDGVPWTVSLLWYSSAENEFRSSAHMATMSWTRCNLVKLLDANGPGDDDDDDDGRIGDDSVECSANMISFLSLWRDYVVNVYL